MTRFSGKTVLIVGAGSGLGAAIAEVFHRDGARLVAVDRDARGLARYADRDTRCSTLCADAADPASMDEAVRMAGAVDILVHTAGIDPLSATDVPGTSLMDWQAVLSVNLTSAFLSARAVLPGMIERRRGTLLFTGSVAGLRPTPREAAYSVSKAGVIQLARAIALDHAREGIRANALCPGFLESVMADRRGMLSESALTDRSRAAAALVPLGREGRYDEMASLALTLCDDAVSGYVTGQAIVADGGMLLG
jgi:NAD(P)-dependent dehydrogenase (short-subunit alcohol dehydrogenase family)